MSLLAAAVWIATHQAAAFRDVVFGVLRGKGYTDCQIADLLGIGQGQLAEQKRLNQHLSVYRLASLPIDLQREIFGAYLKTLGVTVIDDSALGEYLTLQIANLKKKPIKMTLPQAAAERIA